MGLYKQPNSWTCGPFALKHAMVVLGRIADERHLARVAGTSWWSGTDEIRLARAAHAYDCDLPLLRRTDPELARRELVRTLRHGVPVLLCVDDWEHWITAVAYDHARFVVIDSRQNPVVNVLDWRELRARWRFVDEDRVGRDGQHPVLFDLHPVRPRFRVQVKARFSVQRARFMRRPENIGLALHWDQYLADLLEICRPRNGQRAGAVTMGEFMRRHLSLLLPRVAHWHGGVERRELEQLFRNFRFVAETYGLVIPEAAMRRPIADLAILGALWSAARIPVMPLYANPPKPRKRKPRAKPRRRARPRPKPKPRRRARPKPKPRRRARPKPKRRRR